MREKQVYPTDEIPHLWAHGNGTTETKGGIRNSASNLYCSDDGTTIYSYGGHFPIAERIETKQGVVFLMTTRRYSVTTDKHIAAVRQAIRGLGTVFHIDPGPGRTIWNAIEKRQGTRSAWVAGWFNERIERETRAATKPRIRGTTRLRHIDAAKRLRAEWVALHEFFKLPCSVNRVPEIAEDIDALKAEHAEAIEKERKAQERREASARRAAAQRHKAALRLVDRWREGERHPTAPMPGDNGRDVSIHDISYPVLRMRHPIHGDSVVESSHGARVPVDSAKALLRMIPRMDYDKLIPVEVGPYKGVRVNSTHLHIGCQSIPWVEVFAFCDYYEWDKPIVPSAPEPAEAATA